MAKIRVYERPKINYYPKRLNLKKPPRATVNRCQKNVDDYNNENRQQDRCEKNQILKGSTSPQTTIAKSGTKIQLDHLSNIFQSEQTQSLILNWLKRLLKQKSIDNKS
ncbi:hypothetical protein [Halalkalibacter lacteus]|uniref:hypothetical protein n=1 Tax=Halalkalibacter lacteus TaxID=3090663 RepID=UPI002FCC70E3